VELWTVRARFGGFRCGAGAGAGAGAAGADYYPESGIGRTVKSSCEVLNGGGFWIIVLCPRMLFYAFLDRQVEDMFVDSYEKKQYKKYIYI
jgi:hypothetical protein